MCLLLFEILDQPAHQGLQRMVSQLNTVYRANPTLWARDSDAGGFQWIDGADNGRLVQEVRQPRTRLTDARILEPYDVKEFQHACTNGVLAISIQCGEQS